MRILRLILASRISNKIILPYLLLALLLAVAATFLAVRLTAGALQDRMDNRLAEAAQVTADGLVATEDQQLEQLRAMAFTEGAAAALAAGDRQRLDDLLRPHWANAGLHALVAFDTSGRPLLAWRRATGGRADTPPLDAPPTDLESWWVVRQITAGASDAYGDKYSVFRDGMLYTAAPVRSEGRLVGGLMVGLPVDVLLERLQSRSQASVTTLYDASGTAVATTQILAGEATVPAVPPAALARLAEAGAAPLHVQSVVSINGRDHQFAYAPLRVRRAVSGYLSVALPRSFIVDTWSGQRVTLAAVALAMLAAVVGVGLAVARQITRPLRDLVGAARAVAAGELRRRSEVTSRDELGVVARAFNQMTERLLHLYETSRRLSAHSEIGAILAQTADAVQPLVPGAAVVALVEDEGGWRFYAPPGGPDVSAMPPMDDPTVVLALAKQAARPQVAPPDVRRLRKFRLPAGYAEVCFVALSVQSRPIGLLFALHERRGAFDQAAIEPLAAIASMAATALHNTRLYLAVQAEGNRRRAILESIADGVIVCDAERAVALMNPAAEAMLGVRDWPRRRYRFDDLPLAPALGSSALLGAEGIAARYEAGGSILAASVARLDAPGGGLAGEVVVLRNISAEAALDQAKTDLIALISHELRTPLTAMHGAVDMLKKGIAGPLTPLQAELSDTALRQTSAMSALIDKAIMVAHIEAGTLEVDAHPVGVEMVVEAAAGPLRAAAAASEVELVVSVPRDLPLVRADARLLRMALHQLIDNAIKYGPGAPVRVEAMRHGAGVAICVRDCGPGIPPEDLPHLFGRLRRGAGALDQAPRGLGLGLAIARELVERQGGTISVQSELRRGSTFSIYIPEAGDGAK